MPRAKLRECQAEPHGYAVACSSTIYVPRLPVALGTPLAVCLSESSS